MSDDYGGLIVPDDPTADERTRREEHAERVRDAYRRMPGFTDMLKRAQADVRAGRLIDHEGLLRKHSAADSTRYERTSAHTP